MILDEADVVRDDLSFVAERIKVTEYTDVHTLPVSTQKGLNLACKA